MTESLPLGWDLSMWRIEASGEGKSLWPHEQLTCWRCWKTRLIDPRQVRSSSGFDANFPDDSPLPCFVRPGWLTALIYSLFVRISVAVVLLSSSLPVCCFRFKISSLLLTYQSCLYRFTVLTGGSNWEVALPVVPSFTSTCNLLGS